MIRKYILSVLNIEEEELRKTLLLTVYIFLIITSLLVIKPTISSLFLSELSSTALPLGYVLTALFAIIGSYFYNKTLENRAFNKIIEGTIIGSITCLLVFGIAFKLNLIHGFWLFIPYVWVAIFGLLTASQFWILANLVYNIREAKRVFGFIGSGAILGGIVGGYVTSILTFFLKAEDLLFVAAFFILFCIPIVRYIWKNEVVHLNDFQKSIRSEPISKNPFKLIRQSKLLSLIALGIGLSVVVAKLVDYQYSYYASKLIPNPENLAAFFGFWFSTLSIVSLVIQLFVTKKVLGFFGVGKSLLWLPFGVLFGSMILIIIPQLWVIVLIKVVDGGLKQSINKSATELLSIPVPIEIKKRTKTFIDVVIDSIATGIAGFILIFFINGLKIPSEYISLIIVGFILVWIYIIHLLGNEYVNSFKNLFISDDNTPLSGKKRNISKASVTESIRQVLQTGAEPQTVFMLQKTLETKVEIFFPEIKSLLNHESPRVKVLAIENLYFLHSENLSAEMELKIKDDDQEVTTAAFRYLLKFYQGDLVKFFAKYLSSKDETIANAAIIGLSMELRNYAQLQEKFNFHQLLKTALLNLETVKDENAKLNKTLALLESIGNSRSTYFYYFIERHLGSDNPDILRCAISSAGLTLDPVFVDLLSEKLTDKMTRPLAINALNNYGSAVINVLVSNCISGKYRVELAKFIPHVIFRFPSQKGIKGLINLIDNCEHVVKIQAIFFLTKLKWEYPNLIVRNRAITDRIMDECEMYHHILSVFHSQLLLMQKEHEVNKDSTELDEHRQKLIQLLENRLDRHLERIFKFLGVKFPPQEIDAVLNILQTGAQDQRIHAIEFLDNILDSQLKKELIPIAEFTLIDNVSDEHLNRYNIKLLEEMECYKVLLKLKDYRINLQVLSLIEVTKDESYLDLLQSFLTLKKGIKVKGKVQKVISTLSNT